MVNRPFYEAAKYMDGVDEVIVYDKKGEHKGLKGFLHFYQQHKSAYQGRFDAAFVIYGNERGILLAKLLRVKQIYSDNKGFLRYFLSNGKIEYGEKVHTQDKHTVLFEAYSGKTAKVLPMRYTPPVEAQGYVEILLKEMGVEAKDHLVALCTTSKLREKDMNIETCIALIKSLQKRGRKILFVGAGEAAVAYANTLREKGCNIFIDLTNRTTISQLAAVLKKCRCAVSVDTGTMHLICALKIPLLALFYLYDERHLSSWAPKDFYPHKLMAGEKLSVEEMLQNIDALEANSIQHA